MLEAIQPYVSSVNNWLTKDNSQNIKNIALAGKLIGSFGQPYFPGKGETSTTNFQNTVAQMLAGSDIPGVQQQTAPAPTTPQPEPTKVQQVAPVGNQQARKLTPSQDTNGNGVPDFMETTLTLKSKTPAAMGNPKYNAMQQPSGIPYATIGDILGNFQDSTGLNAETPVSASNVSAKLAGPAVEPSVQQLNIVPNQATGRALTPEQLRFHNLAGLVGFDNAMKVADNDTRSIVANAGMIDATTKQMLAPSQMAKMNAETDKMNFEMSPKYIKFQGLVKYYEKSGEKQAEMEAREAIIQDASRFRIVEPRLKAYGTYGNLMRATGATDVSSAINAAMRADATIDAAVIRARATVGAAGATSDAIIKGALLGLRSENTKRLRELDKYEIPIVLPENPTQAQIEAKDLQDTAFENGSKIPGTQANIDEKIQLKANDAAVGIRLGEIAGVPNVNKPVPNVGDKVRIKVGNKTMDATVTKPGVARDANGIEYSI